MEIQKKEKRCLIQLRIDENTKEQFKEFVEKKEQSMSQFLKQVINEALTKEAGKQIINNQI